MFGAIPNRLSKGGWWERGARRQGRSIPSSHASTCNLLCFACALCSGPGAPRRAHDSRPATMLVCCPPPVTPAAVLLPRRHCGMLATRLVHEARLKELEMKRTEAARRQLQEEVQRRQQQLSQQRVQRVQELQQRTRQLLSRAEQLSEEEQQRLVQEVGRAGIRTAQVRTAVCKGLPGCTRGCTALTAAVLLQRSRKQCRCAGLEVVGFSQLAACKPCGLACCGLAPLPPTPFLAHLCSWPASCQARCRPPASLAAAAVAAVGRSGGSCLRCCAWPACLLPSWRASCWRRHRRPRKNASRLRWTALRAPRARCGLCWRARQGWSTASLAGWASATGAPGAPLSWKC